MTDDDQIIDAEIVSPETDDDGKAIIPEETTQKGNAGASSDAASDALNLTQLINRYVSDIEKSKNQLKEQRQMVKDAFENDAGYAEMNKKVKDLTKERNVIKQKLLKTPAAEAAVAKAQELAAEIKDMETALSGYLQEHLRTTGQRTIEGDDGELREIVPVYRLVKRREE